jgi:lactoylglutathione lyase
MKTIILLFLIFILNLMGIFAQSNTDEIQVTINHVAISVTDLEESEQFYRDVIGLKQIEEPFGVGRHAWFDMGHSELHVIRAADERKVRDRSNHLCFSVNDMEGFIEKIRSHGIEFTDAAGNQGEINIRPDGIQQIYFTDPDGYWIEINDDM